MDIKRMKAWLYVMIVGGACIISLILSISFGALPVSFLDIFNALFHYNNEVLTQKIIIELRLPRALLAFFTGVGLALSGLMLQTVTRNPLADPYLFGVSSGASFGVVLLVSLLGAQSALVMSSGAFLGSMLAMSLLLFIASHKGNAQVELMLLAGVAISFLFGAFTSLLLYWSDPQAITAILFWNLGSFSRADWQWLWLPVLVVCFAVLLVGLYRKQLAALLMGDESATTLGVNVHKLRLAALILSALITAVLVAASGGIGFVGLMVPHIVRHFVSQATLLGLVSTCLVGGVLLVWVDVIARTSLESQELPVGVITAALGSLFFLGLLIVRRKSTTI